MVSRRSPSEWLRDRQEPHRRHERAGVAADAGDRATTAMTDGLRAYEMLDFANVSDHYLKVPSLSAYADLVNKTITGRGCSSAG
jgi:hypothetical protein